MDLIFDIIADFVLSLLGKATRRCKNPKTQIIIDILVAAVFLLVVDGYATWSAVRYYRQGNVLLAAVFASVVVISFLLIGFVVLRRIIRKRKAVSVTNACLGGVPMDDRIVDPNRGVRRILYGLGASILLAIPFVVYLEKNVIVLMVGILVLLGCSGAILVMSAVTYPYVILHADGVLVRFLFQKKLYRWDEIAQAGRYWNNRKSPAMQFFSLVLICAGGSPKRAGKDRTFLARNFMKAIALPNEREIRLFITENYGPLDFDDYKGISSWEKKLYELDKT